VELQTNPELELASDYVRNTSRHVFLTGKAGSGKTTFLHQLKSSRLKRMAVVAPTGVAAINAGGMTIHSLFQISFGLHLPGVARSTSTPPPRFRQEKVRLIQSLDLLVIDEVSMVRADLLDAVDEVLRRIRNRPQPFGGVQLLMIGDLHQLPPVVQDEEWQLLKQYYTTPYFFGSQALQKTNYISIELQQIYRQADTEFIELLNKVRENRMDSAALQMLNARYQPNYRPPADQPSITLTATNARAHSINQGSLRQLLGALKKYQATISGQFPPSSYPTEETLEFKVGAQVMFIRNDPGGLYFNGKLGRITRLGEGEIGVQCPGETGEIQVWPLEWKNVKYSLNDQTKEIEERVHGLFVQMPLKLAWAITIHKSQGLTFERCQIDAQAAFAAGQVYVALSRCKTLDGIVLQSRIPAASIKTDPVIQEFCDEAAKQLPSAAELAAAKRDYQNQAMVEIFDFAGMARGVRQWVFLGQEHAQTVLPETRAQFLALQERVSNELVAVSNRFRPQLDQYLAAKELPEENADLQARLAKAAHYFFEKLQAIRQESQQIALVTDRRDVTESLNKVGHRLQTEFAIKQAGFRVCAEGFTTERFYRALVDAELDVRGPGASDSNRQCRIPKGLPNPKLYEQLWAWRQSIVESQNLSDHEVMPRRALRDLVTYLPTTKAEILKLPGIGKVRFQKYGAELLEQILKYCAENPQATPLAAVAKSANPAVSETKQLSFNLWKMGKSIEEIAAERRITVGTVSNHLAAFVEQGLIEVAKFLSPEKVTEILAFFAANPDSGLTIAKEHFGDKYDYHELRWVAAHARYLAQTPAAGAPDAKPGKRLANSSEID
jgi:hypothetical protein